MIECRPGVYLKLQEVLPALHYREAVSKLRELTPGPQMTICVLTLTSIATEEKLVEIKLARLDGDVWGLTYIKKGADYIDMGPRNN